MLRKICNCYGLAAAIYLLVPLGIFANSLATSNHSLHSLRFVVQQTLRRNPEVLQRVALLYAAQAAIREAGGKFLPEIGVRFAQGRETTEDMDTANRDLALTRTERSWHLIQPLFSGFSTYNLVKQRRAEFSAARFNESYIENVIALQATNAYLEILRLKKIHKIVVANIEAHRKTLAKVRMKFRGGAGRKTEVALARGRLARREATLKSVVGAQQESYANFIKIVGFAAPQVLVEPGMPRVPAALANVLKIAIDNNQQLKAARANLTAANASARGSKGRMFPTVNIEVRQGDYDNLDGIKGRVRNVRTMLVVNYNLFNGGSDVARISRAEFNKEAALENLATVHRRIVAEATTAWVQLMTDRKQLVDLAAHLNSSKAVLAGYEEQFTLGKRSLLDLLNMENEVFNSEATLVNEKYAVKLDSYNLLATMGVLVGYF